MNSPQKIPRRSNRLRQPVGSHWTLTRVVLNQDGKFGFGLSDDGKSSVYIPRSIIERYDITPEDEGAGFCAPLKPNSERPGEHPWVMSPLIWDDDATSPLEGSDEELEEILLKIEDLPNVIRNIDNAVNVLVLCRRELQSIIDWKEDTYDAV